MKKETIAARQQQLRQQYSKSTSVINCFIAYKEYGGYRVPNSSAHRPAAQMIISGEIWEKATLAHLTSRTGQGDIVHAGTYFGDFLSAFSGACEEGATVWAFEPNPENFRCAQVNAIINDLKNVQLTNAGLGVGRGSAIMVVKDAHDRGLGDASKIVSGSGFAEAAGLEEIRIVAIDEVVPHDREVSIIQLDVEGFERQAVEGGIETIRRCKPLLCLETLPQDDWFANQILSLGYKVEARIDENVVLKA